MKNLITFFMLIILIGFIAGGCKKDSAEEVVEDLSGCNPDSSITVSYCRDISVIMKNHCGYSGCHSNSDKKAGIILTRYSNISDQTKNGEVICTMEHSGCGDAMPLNAAKLPDSVIAKVKAWKNLGAPNN